MLMAYFASPLRMWNHVLLASSILFYSWGAPKFIFVILETTIIDFLLVRKMDHSDNSFHRRMFLAISVCINVGLLFYFKYSNFFIQNF
jgi:alginate O-acetyltransferase complex protein AlgI